MSRRADLIVAANYLSVGVIGLLLVFVPGISDVVLAFLTTAAGMLLKNISTANDYEFGSSVGSKTKEDSNNKMVGAITSMTAKNIGVKEGLGRGSAE